MFEYKKIRVFPENFLKKSVHIIDNEKDAYESLSNMESDINVSKEDISAFISSKPSKQSLEKYLKKFIIEDIPNVKNEIVWNYTNFSGLCNPSAIMFIQYSKFVLDNLQKLISANHSEEVIERIFKESCFPEINLALYYGQTVLGVVMYFIEALHYDNNLSTISRNHFYTHFNCLESNLLKINYNIIPSNISVNRYLRNDKRDIFKRFVMNNVGCFKSHEDGHACCLILTDSLAIYINNSLLSRFPLVCPKNEFIETLEKYHRWNKEWLFEKGHSESVPLFDVIIDYDRFDYDLFRQSFWNNSMSGGDESCEEPVLKECSKECHGKLLMIIIITISFVAVIVLSILCLKSCLEDTEMNPSKITLE